MVILTTPLRLQDFIGADQATVEMIPPVVYITNLLHGRFGKQGIPDGDLKQETPKSEV